MIDPFGVSLWREFSAKVAQLDRQQWRSGLRQEGVDCLDAQIPQRHRTAGPGAGFDRIIGSGSLRRHSRSQVPCWRSLVGGPLSEVATERAMWASLDHGPDRRT